MRTLALAALLGLSLAGCAAKDHWVYDVPAGGSAEQLRRDQQACAEESEITRLNEDRVILERSCMNDRGYIAHPAP